MSDAGVLQAVQHYQRSIEKNSSDVARLLHCVGKLYKLPITVIHLQETGVGRTVNALRKHNGELGVAAQAVVNKWKEIVAAESDRRANDESSSEHEHNDRNADDIDTATQAAEHEQQIEKPLNENDTKHASSSSTKSRSPNNPQNHSRHKSQHKEKERPSGKDKKRRSESKSLETNSNSSHKRRKVEERNNDKNMPQEEKGHKEHKHRENERKKHDTSKHHHSSSSRSGKHRSQDKHNEEGSNKSQIKAESKGRTDKRLASADVTPPQPNSSTSSDLDSKKRLPEDAAPNSSSSKKLNTHSNNELKREKNKVVIADDDGIDSSMGANFADVLGMLNMPQKKAKKSLSALKQTSPSSKKAANENNNQKTSNSSTSTSSSSSSTKLNSGRAVDFDGPSTSSQLNLEKKPVLLNSNVKLAPLDPSIALELPVISNNYKPMPLNPTVMDCVFNSSTSSSSRAPPRLFSDAEALSHGISSKTIRTKVYSGVKTGQLFQVPSLFDLCIRVLQKNIDALEYTGGVPFDVLRPVLERASPQQLFIFEQYNPYLMDDSDALWQQHVHRNYRCQKRQEMESWRDMFMRCQDEQERRLSMLAQNIKQSQKVMAEPVRKTQLAFVDTMVKPPRNIMRKQEQYGTKSKLVATPAARVAALSSVTPNAAKTGDARLRTSAAIKFDPAQAAFAPARPKKAPLMAKTLQFIRGRQRR